MVIVIRGDAPQEEIEHIKKKMKTEHAIDIHESIGQSYHLLGIVGDTSTIDPSMVQANRIVEKLIIVQEPYKKANKMFHPKDTVIDVLGQQIGGGTFSVIAGPCSVESRDDFVSISEKIKASSFQHISPA